MGKRIVLYSPSSFIVAVGGGGGSVVLPGLHTASSVYRDERVRISQKCRKRARDHGPLRTPVKGGFGAPP